MDIAAVLQGARSADNNIRTQAEQYLSQYESQEPTGYFVSLAALLKEEGKPDDIRQLAGLMIKNALDAEDSIIQRRKHQRWSELPDGVKVGVRNDLVAALAASSEGTRHGAAQAIAKAGAIDVPAGAWPDLLPGLLSAVSNAGLADGIKAATLRALGYLLEELGLEAVGQSVVNQILTAIVDGMATGRAQEVRREAGRALEHALDFASENFSDAHVGERNAIMSAICNATQSDDAVTRSGAYACVTRVAELYYDQIGMYMDTLAQLTFAAARGKQEDTAVLAVEFWDVIADEESDRGDDASNKKYIAAALTPLTDLLLELMCKQEEDEDDESYSTAQAAGVCLTSVSHAVGDTVLSVVMPFVQKGFSSADWHVRDAATLAFGIMCGTGSSEAITPLITQALPPLIQRLVAGAPTFDASAPVRDTTAWVVGHIMETCFDDLGMSDETFGRLVNVLHAALDDEARVAQNVAFALECIGFKMEGAEGEDGKTQLSPHLMTVIGHLLTRADKEDRNERNLRTACYAAIMAIVENAGSADEALLLQLLMEAGRRLQSAFARPPAASADDREELQSLVTQTAALIQTLVIALGGSVKPAADALVPLLLRVFDSRCTPAYQEAYRALGAVSAGVGEGFVAFMPLVFPVVMEGLKLVEDAQTCCAAVYALSEITTALDGAFDPYVADAVGVLLRNVSMVEVQRSVKPPSLSVFGDVAMGVGSAAFSPHVQSVMQILDMAAATVNPNKGKDEDTDEYIAELRKSVLEAWVGIFQGWNNNQGSGRLAVLAPYVPRVLHHLEIWSREFIAQADAAKGDETLQPDLDAVKQVVGLMGDIATTMGKAAVHPYLKKSTDWVRKVLDIEDALERGEWGDELKDEEGQNKETIAQYARGALA